MLNHSRPGSCAAVREGGAEALIGTHSPAIESRKYFFGPEAPEYVNDTLSQREAISSNFITVLCTSWSRDSGRAVPSERKMIMALVPSSQLSS
jgi:hypothetical protein